jgi:glycosyltransferase involved in cell wall biosynthesis
MHICLIAQEFPPETGWGGIGSYTFILAQGLVELGEDVTVIAEANEHDHRYIENKIEVHRVARKKKTWRSKIFQRFFPITFQYIGWSYQVAKKVAEIHKYKKIDIIETSETNAPGFFLSLLTKIPLIVKLHTPYYIHCKLNGYPISFDLKLFSLFEKTTVKRASKVISCSKAMVKYLDEGRYLKVNDVKIVPNPIDEIFFSPRLSSCPAKNIKILLYVGRIEQRKGVDTLFEAFLKVCTIRKDVRLQIAGADGRIFINERLVAYSDFLKRKINNAEVLEYINFLGKINRNNLVACYQKADICIIPSAVFENFPYTCLEAMACGAAIIASNCGGIPEMIENNISGILVEPSHSDELARAILYLLGNPHVALRMGSEARKSVEKRFTQKHIVLKNLTLYKDAIKQHSRAI